jgi:stage V sporulation protein B
MKRSFISGAAILVVSGLIIRLLGFVYRVYLSNLVGSEGMGLIQLIMPVYSLIILTLTSGISISVSKLTAEERARGNECNTGRITRVAVIIVLVGGVAAALVMLIFGKFISNTILKDPRTYLSILALVPCIPVVACASAIKGYFYGVQNVVPTALSNIIEQVVRIGLVMALLTYSIGEGLEYTCALVTVASAIGEIVNLAVTYITYVRDRKKSGRSGVLMRKRVIAGKIIRTSVPISFNRFITSMMGTLEAILIPRRLLAGGLAYTQSLKELGKLSGMAAPLLFFPTVITSALATTLVPAISEAISLKNYHLANTRISKALQISFVMGFVFTFIFMCYSYEIGNLLYSRENIGSMLYQLSFTCVFIYISQTFTGILNAFDKQAESLRNSIIADVIRLGVIYFVVPQYGITGYVWGIIASSFIVCILNLKVIIKTTGMSINFRNWIIKPGVICAGMYFISKYLKAAMSIFPFSEKIDTIILVCGSVALAMLAMSFAGVFNIKDLLKSKKKTYKLTVKRSDYY